MLKQVSVVTGLIIVCASIQISSTILAPQATPAPAGQTPAKATSTPASLAGTWRSEEQRTPLATAFDQSVWGAGAVAVRTVELTVQKTGEARLLVTKKVVDGKGKTVAASTSVEEAQITIGESRETVGGRMEHAVKVARAERRYPDDPGSKWPLDGLGVKVVAFADPGMIEVRFDTPEGTGSFWETLRRAGAAAKGTSK
jgi:hypothetical protein